MASQLDAILAHKRDELALHKQQHSLAALRDAAEQAPTPRDFFVALRQRVEQRRSAVIAEIKQASPSKGQLVKNFDPARIAQAYTKGRAACLSVLTDQKFFGGHNRHLGAARANSGLPVLRKDFVLDEYHIYQARAIEADAILLVVAALDDHQLRDYHQLAGNLGMAALVEVHNLAELDRALVLRPPLLGINNRDLRSFDTNLKTSEQLAPRALQGGSLVVAESGISSHAQLKQLHQVGIYAFLIGEGLITAPNPADALVQLLDGNTTPRVK